MLKSVLHAYSHNMPSFLFLIIFVTTTYVKKKSSQNLNSKEKRNLNDKKNINLNLHIFGVHKRENFHKLVQYKNN